jgi:hypothetical protein
MSLLRLLLIVSFLSPAGIMLSASDSRALTCKPQLDLGKQLNTRPTLTPRGVLFVELVGWKKLRDVAALVEVGKPDGPRWALEPLSPISDSPPAFDSGGELLLRPVKPLPVGKRVMLAPDFESKIRRVPVRRISKKTSAQVGWLVVDAPKPERTVKPVELEAKEATPSDRKSARRSMSGKGFVYDRSFTFEPAPPKSAILVRATARTVLSPVQGIPHTLGIRRMFAASPSLSLGQSHCSGNFPVQGRKNTLSFEFLDAQGQVVGFAKSMMNL